MRRYKVLNNNHACIYDGINDFLATCEKNGIYTGDVVEYINSNSKDFSNFLFDLKKLKIDFSAFSKTENYTRSINGGLFHDIQAATIGKPDFHFIKSYEKRPKINFIFNSMCPSGDYPNALKIEALIFISCLFCASKINAIVDGVIYKNDAYIYGKDFRRFSATIIKLKLQGIKNLTKLYNSVSSVALYNKMIYANRIISNKGTSLTPMLINEKFLEGFNKVFPTFNDGVTIVFNCSCFSRLNYLKLERDFLKIKNCIQSELIRIFAEACEKKKQGELKRIINVDFESFVK